MDLRFIGLVVVAAVVTIAYLVGTQFGGTPDCPYPGLMIGPVLEHDTLEVPPDLPDTIAAIYGPRSPIDDCPGTDVSQIILANRGKSIQVETDVLGGVDPCDGRRIHKALRIWTKDPRVPTTP